jgi:hypothetical protein
MLRHADKSMNAIYHGRNVLLKQIQEKLERHQFKGKTQEEIVRASKAEWMNLCIEGLQEGLTTEEATERAKAIIYAKPESVRLRAFVETMKTNPPS